MTLVIPHPHRHATSTSSIVAVAVVGCVDIDCLETCARTLLTATDADLVGAAIAHSLDSLHSTDERDLTLLQSLPNACAAVAFVCDDRVRDRDLRFLDCSLAAFTTAPITVLLRIVRHLDASTSDAVAAVRRALDNNQRSSLAYARVQIETEPTALLSSFALDRKTVRTTTLADLAALRDASARGETLCAPLPVVVEAYSPHYRSKIFANIDQQLDKLVSDETLLMTNMSMDTCRALVSSYSASWSARLLALCFDENSALTDQLASELKVYIEAAVSAECEELSLLLGERDDGDFARARIICEAAIDLVDQQYKNGKSDECMAAAFTLVNERAAADPKLSAELAQGVREEVAAHIKQLALLRSHIEHKATVAACDLLAYSLESHRRLLALFGSRGGATDDDVATAVAASVEILVLSAIDRKLSDDKIAALVADFKRQVAAAPRVLADLPPPPAWRGRRSRWSRFTRRLRHTWRAIRGPMVAIAIATVAPELLTLAPTATAMITGGAASFGGSIAGGVRNVSALTKNTLRGALLAGAADFIGGALPVKTIKHDGLLACVKSTAIRAAAEATCAIGVDALVCGKKGRALLISALSASVAEVTASVLPRASTSRWVTCMASGASSMLVALAAGRDSSNALFDAFMQGVLIDLFNHAVHGAVDNLPFAATTDMVAFDRGVVALQSKLLYYMAENNIDPQQFDALVCKILPTITHAPVKEFLQEAKVLRSVSGRNVVALCRRGNESRPHACYVVERGTIMTSLSDHAANVFAPFCIKPERMQDLHRAIAGASKWLDSQPPVKAGCDLVAGGHSGGGGRSYFALRFHENARGVLLNPGALVMDTTVASDKLKEYFVHKYPSVKEGIARFQKCLAALSSPNKGARNATIAAGALLKYLVREEMGSVQMGSVQVHQTNGDILRAVRADWFIKNASVHLRQFRSNVRVMHAGGPFDALRRALDAHSVDSFLDDIAQVEQLNSTLK